MAPTCFSPSGPSSGSMQRNLAKVTVTVERYFRYKLQHFVFLIKSAFVDQKNFAFIKMHGKTTIKIMGNLFETVL